MIYKSSYTYQGKRYDSKSSSTRLKKPIDIVQFKKHKKNLVSLVEEFVKKEGTTPTFHFYADDSAMEHGFDGWGFTVRRESGLYKLASSYSIYGGKKEVYKGEEMSNALHWLNRSYLYKVPKHIPSRQVSKLLSEGCYKSFRLGLKLELKDIAINVVNWGDVAFLETDDAQDWFDKGIISEHNLTILFSLKGSPKSVDKYFAKFERRLGTVFVKEKE